MPSPGVAVRGLAVRLDGTPILRGVDLCAPAGSWLGVIGPNGAGKSTLLRAVAGLLRFDGEVRVGGVAPAALSPRQRARRLAYAPQVPVMPPDMAVFDYVLLGRTPYIGYLARESRADRMAATAILDRLDLRPLQQRRLESLSGGERQRVVLARALAQEAPVLLLDEPTTSLDLGHQQQVLELVDQLRRADRLTVVTTLHDLSLAGQYADELLLLAGGRAVAAGEPVAVLTEELLAAHYGARVSVTTDGAGRPVVQLVRPGRSDRGEVGGNVGRQRPS